MSGPGSKGYSGSSSFFNAVRKRRGDYAPPAPPGAGEEDPGETGRRRRSRGMPEAAREEAAESGASASLRSEDVLEAIATLEKATVAQIAGHLHKTPQDVVPHLMTLGKLDLIGDNGAPDAQRQYFLSDVGRRAREFAKFA